MFSTFRPAVDHVLQSFSVEHTTTFRQFIRDELSEISPDIHHQPPEKKQLSSLYELRARYLDWELGTGYLGFFSNNSGTRYTFTKRLEAVFQMIARNEIGRILEIGCGAGLLCLELGQRAKTVVGIDISHFVLDFANHVKDYIHYKNVFFQQGDAENLAFQDESFDLVICSEVLEHLLSPQKALDEMRRVTKKDGSIILTTPCAVSLSALCMKVLRIFNKHIESEKHIHFDKKTYLAIKRAESTIPSNKLHFLIHDSMFIRVHFRFHYRELVVMFHKAGLEVEQVLGTILAFPPQHQVFYRYCPAKLLPVIRFIESVLNSLQIFYRFGAATTCFCLTPQKNQKFLDNHL